MIANGRTESGAEKKERGLEDGAAIAPRVVAGVRRADERLVTLVQERPIVALCGAALVGYMIGRVVTRLG
jgi:hypothetical protein